MSTFQALYFTSGFNKGVSPEAIQKNTTFLRTSLKVPKKNKKFWKFSRVFSANNPGIRLEVKYHRMIKTTLLKFKKIQEFKQRSFFGYSF